MLQRQTAALALKERDPDLTVHNRQQTADSGAEEVFLGSSFQVLKSLEFPGARKAGVPDCFGAQLRAATSFPSCQRLKVHLRLEHQVGTGGGGGGSAPSSAPSLWAQLPLLWGSLQPKVARPDERKIPANSPTRGSPLPQLPVGRVQVQFPLGESPWPCPVHGPSSSALSTSAEPRPCGMEP